MALGTVLLIEDNPGDARLVREYLAEVPSLSCDLAHVPSLGAGLDRLAAGDVDLVLLDLSLPDSDSLDSLDQIRARAPHVPIVVLTGNVGTGLAERALREGAQDYLIKNEIDSASLARVLRFAVERNRVVARLRELDRFKSELISTVSHELRTPLTIVREFVSVVHDGVAGPLTAEQTECMDAALRNCDRMAVLIDDLLDLSRIESGRIRLRRERLGLGELIRQCRDDFAPQCRARGQEIFAVVPDDLPPVLGDRTRILQVLVNLCGNAHKFTQDGGRIALRAGREGDVVWVEVEDNGPGIVPGDLEAIFEAFAQLDREHGPGARGTGLGLTISRRIARLHGGDLTVDSERGRGSRFRICVPVYHAGEAYVAYVEDRLRAASAAARDLALVLVRAAPGMADGDDELTLLRHVVRTAESVFHHHRDEALLLPAERVAAFLLEADETGSRIMLQRLVAALPAGGPAPGELQTCIAELGTADDRERWLDLLRGPFEPLGPVVRQPQGRVLIVDDDDAVLDMIAGHLGRAGSGIAFRTARNGYDACILFAELEPDVVVLDVNLPGMDGAEVFASMRGSRHGPLARFLAISGDAGRLHAMEGLGCDDVLAKPFDGRALVERVVGLLDRHATVPARGF